MLRTILVMFTIGGMAAWGQTRDAAPGGADKVDRAAAYYHFTVAHMYAEMAAASRGRNREYVNKAIENYQAAIQADPQAPMPREELLLISSRAHVPVPLPPALPRSPAPR